MYAALAAESESSLGSALLYEDDVGRAYSFQEQFTGPSNFRNQRVRLDQELMRVLGHAHRGTNFTQQNVVAGDSIRAHRSLPRVLFPVDIFVEREREVSVRREVEPHVEFPWLLEGRSLGSVGVSPGQTRRNRIRVTVAAAARRTQDSSYDCELNATPCHDIPYES